MDERDIDNEVATYARWMAGSSSFVIDMEMVVQREERHGNAFESFLRDHCDKEEN